MGAHTASGTTHAPAGSPGASTESMPEAAAAEALRAGVSWGAVFAGATVVAALSLVFHLLGAGVGFAAVSPWGDHTSAAVGVSAILWLSFTQLLASALGGFLAGRLRVKWGVLHDDDLHFRDAAHGLLSWAVATLVAAAFFGGLIGKTVTGAAGLAAPAVSAHAGHGAVQAAAGPNGDAAHSPDYLVDVMLRSERAGSADAGLRQEAMRILASGVANGRLAVADRAWLTRRVADRSGLGREDAEKRVDDAFAGSAAAAAKARAGAREAAEAARKAAASTALWLTLALLLGACIASWCAMLGGRVRDRLAATPVR